MLPVILLFGVGMICICLVLIGIGGYYVLRPSAEDEAIKLQSQMDALDRLTGEDSSEDSSKQEGDSITDILDKLPKLPPPPAPAPVPTPAAPAPVGPPANCVKYGAKVYIAKYYAPSYRLRMKSGQALEKRNELSRHTQLALYSSDNSNHGCIKYGDSFFISKADSVSHRLKMRSGNAYERKHDIGNDSKMVIQSAENKSGYVIFGDKIHIAKAHSGHHRLRLLSGRADEVHHNIDAHTQLTFQAA